MEIYSARQRLQGEHSLERLAAVDFLDVDLEFYQEAENAVSGIAGLEVRGLVGMFFHHHLDQNWPNCNNDKSYPWTNAKSLIASKVRELT